MIPQVGIFLLLIGCSETLPDQEEKYEAGKVLVHIRQEVALEDAFSFFNQRELQVSSIKSLTYRSQLPADSIDAILNAFSSRSYIYEETRRVRIKDNSLRIMVTLNSMTVDLQSDWIGLMKRFQFTEYGDTRFFGIKVTEGEEKSWVKTLSSQGEVKSSSLNYIRSTLK